MLWWEPLGVCMICCGGIPCALMPSSALCWMKLMRCCLEGSRIRFVFLYFGLFCCLLAKSLCLGMRTLLALSFAWFLRCRLQCTHGSWISKDFGIMVGPIWLMEQFLLVVHLFVDNENQLLYVLVNGIWSQWYLVLIVLFTSLRQVRVSCLVYMWILEGLRWKWQFKYSDLLSNGYRFMTSFSFSLQSYKWVCFLQQCHLKHLRSQGSSWTNRSRFLWRGMSWHLRVSSNSMWMLIGRSGSWTLFVISMRLWPSPKVWSLSIPGAKWTGLRTRCGVWVLRLNLVTLA